MKRIIYLVGFIILIIITSCENEIDNTNYVDFSQLIGEWEVIAYFNSTPIYGPFKLITLKDTPFGNDSITIMDTDVKFWKFEVKALANVENNSFETRLSNCEVSEDKIGIKIPNGMIINSDSIFLEILFEDDETPYAHTYQLKGHRITE